MYPARLIPGAGFFFAQPSCAGLSFDRLSARSSDACYPSFMDNKLEPYCSEGRKLINKPFDFFLDDAVICLPECPGYGNTIKRVCPFRF